MFANDKHSETSTVKQYLKEHPRMAGVLFTMTMLLAQAGSVAGGGYAGP